MDTQWFKERLRAAHVTTQELAEAIGRDRAVVSRILNGRQPMTPEQAGTIARVLDVSLETVIEKAGMFPGAPPRRLQGFAESDAEPWRADSPGNGDDAVAAALGARPGVDVWKVNSRALEHMGLRPGDLVLVDTLERQAPAAGDVVVAQAYDFQSGSAKTLLRRYEPPVLVAATSDPADWRVRIVDGETVAVAGRVVAQWRRL